MKRLWWIFRAFVFTINYLGAGWSLKQCWGIADTTYDNRDPDDSPSDAMLEEFSCWSD